MMKTEEIKKAVEVLIVKKEAVITSHRKIYLAIQILLYLAEDYLAISDSGLLPEEKDTDKIVKEHKNQGASQLMVIQALAKPNGFNVAIHEVRLRYLKNRMTVKEIEKTINEFVLFKCNDPDDEWDGQPVTFKDYNKPDSGKEIATAIFDAINKKIRGNNEKSD